MRTLRRSSSFLILPICLAGCASTSGVSSKMQTVASVGDRPLPVVTGEPGSSVVAEAPLPERSRASTGRISGRVLDETGAPLSDVRVRLAVGKGPGGKVIQSTTDHTGAFTLRGVRPGASYTVIAEWEDDQDRLTGRSVVRAPDTDVQISLAPEELDAPGALHANGSRRVNRVSDREEPEPEAEAEAEAKPEAEAESDPFDEPVNRRRSRSRVNEEDLPPAPEAEAVRPTRPRRAAANTPSEDAPRTSKWRPGGSDRVAVAPAAFEAETDSNASSASLDEIEGRDLPPAMERPEPTSRRKPRTVAPAEEPEEPAAEAPEPPLRKRPPAEPAVPREEEEGPNPLPPALEPGKDSQAARDLEKLPPFAPAPPLMTEVGESLAQVSEPAEGPQSELPQLVEAEPAAPEIQAKAEAPTLPEPPSSGLPTPAQTALATSDLVPPPVVEPAPAPPVEPPPVEPAREMPQTAVAAEVPQPLDQSIFETAEAEPETRAEPSPAEGRKRPTWKDLAAARGGRDPRSSPLLASARPSAAAVVTPTASAAPPRAAPPQPDDGKAYCRYDSKLRRIEDFRLPDLQGRPVRFQDIDADLVLIDFWGTWCQPCIQSVPHLVSLQEKLAPAKVKVVGIACEQGPPAERAARVAQEVRRLGINYPILLSGMDGPCPLQEALHIQAFPTLVLVDRQGRVVWRDQGATPVTLARLDRFLASAIRDGVKRY